MPSGLLSRRVEDRAVADFLNRAATEPSALVVEGEAGIGKTTLWLTALEQARQRGFRVISARAAQAESVLVYAALFDLLAGVDSNSWADLPQPQRRAMDRVLLRAESGEAATDQRAVAAGFLSVVHGLATRKPLLLAIDDVQWLDASSMSVVAFAVRRLSGRVGVLATARTDADGHSSSGWLELPRPEATQRITVRPLSLGALHAVLSERLRRSFSRPTMVRIAEVSGGNPFYALELGRAIEGKGVAEVPLPASLAELVRARLGNLDNADGEALLAVACVGAPTLELVARAVGADDARVSELLDDAENRGIVRIEGQRVRFVHPLLAQGVYTGAAPPRRRMMHRRLAEVVGEPELQARHLALAATSGDPKTLETLDLAAQIARRKGAPAAAAELLDLALGLGGDTPERRIRSARNHLDAGDPQRSRALLEVTIESLEPGALRAKALTQLAAVNLFDANFLEAAVLLERAVGEAEENLPLRTQILISLSLALSNADHLAAAIASIEDAVGYAERLGHPQLLSQALSMQVHLHFLRGDGFDETRMQRALELEDAEADTPAAFSPSEHRALLLSWTGHLEQAREALHAIGRRCVARGEENELIHLAFNSFQIEVWRGNIDEAAAVANDAMERAMQLGGDLALGVALTLRAALAAYAGQEQQARADANEALVASRRCGANSLAVWPITILGFLEVSLGEDHAALTTLEPLLAKLAAMPEATEIIVAAFIPDAARAMVRLGRLHEAEPLIDNFERNGRRLDRPWMLANAARCRGMLLAARGEVDEASRVAQQAMTDHDRLPMPFERARTELLVGQLQRRQRSKEAAAETLRAALGTFEDLGIPLWARRARDELARTTVGASVAAGLTPSEQRVAELAASGMTNRDVAAALFISPKTVEANLARIYRKLHIHSRAELGRHIGPPGG